MLLTIKTGATEASEEIPTQMRTSLRCIPLANTVFFYDMRQQLGQVQLLDALEAIPAGIKEGNSDFDIYRKQECITQSIRNNHPITSSSPPSPQRRTLALLKWGSLRLNRSAQLLSATSGCALCDFSVVI